MSAEKRLHEDNVMALSSTPRRPIATPTNTPVPKEQSRNYIASEHKVNEQLRSLMGSLAHCFVDRNAAHSFIEKSDGDGFKFLELWRADMQKVKPSDLALVTTKRDAAYSRGLVGDLTIDSLNAFIKDYCILERTCPPENRKSNAEMMTLINTTMLSNESTRSGFEQLLMLSIHVSNLSTTTTIPSTRHALCCAPARTTSRWTRSRPTHLSSAACLPSPLLT